MDSFTPENFTVEPVSNIDHIERSFCTNFSCCNILLPDLHALFAHYDSQHLPHLLSSTKCHQLPPALQLDLISDDSDYSRATSPSSSIPSTPSTPHHILTSTPPKIALSAHESINSFNDEDEDMPLFDDSYLIPDYPTYEQCYNAAIAPPGSPFSFSPVSSTLSSPTSATFPLPMADPYPFYSSPSSPASTSILPEQTLDPGAATATCPTLLSATEMMRPQPLSSTSSSPANSAPGSPLSRTGSSSGSGSGSGVGGSHYKRPRDRERKSNAAKYLGRKKLYTCPTPGCSKVYLNPNGLKYHQEKGRCKIEDAAGSLEGGIPMDVSSTVTTTPTTTTATTTTPTAVSAPIPSQPESHTFSTVSPAPTTPTPTSVSPAPSAPTPTLPTLLTTQTPTPTPTPTLPTQYAYHPLYFTLPVFQSRAQAVSKPASQEATSSPSSALASGAETTRVLFQPKPQPTSMPVQSEILAGVGSC